MDALMGPLAYDYVPIWLNGIIERQGDCGSYYIEEDSARWILCDCTGGW